MSAAVVTNIVITCDGIRLDGGGCNSRHTAHDCQEFNEAHAEAKRNGWTHDPIDKLDWCPMHAEEKT